MTLEITAQDQEAAVRIDGKQVMYLHNAKYTPEPGHIGLWIANVAEPEWVEMYIRKIEVMELPPRPPSEPAFTPLFNGKNLDGWTGKADSYFAKKDGSLLANGVENNYAMLRTVKSFENYELRLQCRLTGHGQFGSKTSAGVAVHVTDAAQTHYGIALRVTSGRDAGMSAHASATSAK